MSRYTHLDTDEERLPEGMRRVGYDADTQRYTVVDEHGEYYEGAEGARYGVFRPTGERSDRRRPGHSTEPSSGDGNRAAWRYMFPFFLICAVLLFFLFRYIDSSSVAPSVTCPGSSEKYIIQKGDICVNIATKFDTTVDELKRLNEENGIDCDRLQIGQELCVPIA